MVAYTTVIIVILLLIMMVFIILAVLKEDSNNKKNQHNIIYPFNAKIQSRDTDHSSGAKFVSLVTSDGKTNQIQCPSGTKINIIGSWTDVVDPNGLCSGKVSSTFKLSCGFTDDLSAGVTCATTDDCAAGMECSGAKVCIPKGCIKNSDCGPSGVSCSDLSNSRVGEPCGDGSGGTYIFQPADGYVCINNIIHKDPAYGQCLYCNTAFPYADPNSKAVYTGRCAQTATCANIVTNNDTGTVNAGKILGQNLTCPIYKCAPRDSSAYLAAICDGRRACTLDSKVLKYDPKESSVFGPKPCGNMDNKIGVDWGSPDVSGTVPSGAVPNYEQLPVAAGWGGGQPGSGSNVGATVQPSTYSQGFYVHGLYTCVPDE